MNNYLGEETYVLMFPDGSYLAGFKTEKEAWDSKISPNLLSYEDIKQQLLTKGYAVGKCFVFIPEYK